jgi:hypothetical protein
LWNRKRIASPGLWHRKKGIIIFTDFYLLFGLLIHVALLGLVDWLGYHHLVTHGYDHTLLALALLNIGIFFGIYYLVLRPLHRRLQLRRTARTVRQQRLRS